MARKIIMIAAVAATFVTASAPVAAMAQDRYHGGFGDYSRQHEYGHGDRSRYGGYSDRRSGWIEHERHERWELEDARRRHWQHERWQRQNEGRHWNHNRSDFRDGHREHGDD